ncbi:hypothetical protein PARMER_04042 [Parabacteroides merdae ATCC 43184]|nr:hypothetical protein PARMER_04042 [Parabacteroides merdae ATCC 43184]
MKNKHLFSYQTIIIPAKIREILNISPICLFFYYIFE